MSQGEMAFAAISVLIAFASLVGAGIGWRRRELRREEVLNWAFEAIACIQTLNIMCNDSENSYREENFIELKFRLSILVETGRLFFKNSNFEKSSLKYSVSYIAYQGSRPKVLDKLVFAAQIAENWSTATAEDREKMAQIIDNCRRQFVSIMQGEVGRARTASIETKAAGQSGGLSDLMASLEPN